MKKAIVPLIVVLALPVLATAVSLFARAELDARWRAGLRREFVMHGQRANVQVMQRYSLATLCSEARTAKIPPCRPYNTFSTIILASGATAGVGLLLLGGVLALGGSARRSRNALVAGFRPALYAVSATLVLLLVVHALLGLQIVRLLSVVVGVRSGGLMTFVGVLALAGVVVGSMAAMRMAGAGRGARRLLATRLPGGLVSRLATGTEAPAVAGVVPEVFVAPAGALVLEGRLAAASLHVPLTLARILTVPELQALARRAQFRAGEDEGRVNRLFETWAAVSAEEDAIRRGGGLRLALGLPALSVLSLLLDACADGEAALERLQQVSADRAAADGVGAEACGVAILKAAAFGPAWVAAVRAMRDAVRGGTQYANAFLLFADIVAASADHARIEAVLHPDAATPATSVPLRQRLERLGLAPEGLAGAALDVRPAEPAIGLLGPEALTVEERLTTLVHLQLLH